MTLLFQLHLLSSGIGLGIGLGGSLLLFFFSRLFRGPPKHRVLGDASYNTFFTFEGEVPRVGEKICSPDNEFLVVDRVVWYALGDKQVHAWVFVRRVP